MPESIVVFERTNSEEPALVVKLENTSDLNDPKVGEVLGRVGLSPEEFRKLLDLDFTPIEGPTPESPIYNSRGEKIEDAVTRIVDTPIGRIEVADCKLYKEVVTGKDDQGLHLKVGPRGGFEAIYALSGKATLFFPEKVEPTAPGAYVASKEGEGVELSPGTLAIIPAPTANAWTMVGEGFKFRYICQPMWSSDFVKPAVDE